MRRPTIVALFCLALTLSPPTGVRPSHATEVGGARRFGLGFAIGEPISLVGKYFLSSVNAIDFGLAFARVRRYCARVAPYRCDRAGHLSLHGDYLWQENLAREGFRLDWHIGPGARLSFNDNYYDEYADDVLIFARMPVGLDLTFQRPDFLEVFVEVAPALLLIPAVDLEIEAFVGVRFYF